MIDKIKAASAVLLALALVDGVVNIVEWLGGFDLFAASATVGVVMLLIAMLFDKETNFGKTAQGFFVVGFVHLCQFYHSLCGSGPKDEDTNALADALVADASSEVEEEKSCIHGD